MVFPDNYTLHDLEPRDKSKMAQSTNLTDAPTSNGGYSDMKNIIQASSKFVEEPSTKQLLAETPTTRRSEEYVRPKSKVKPRPLDRLIQTCHDQSIVIRGLLIVILTSIPFVIFVIVAVALPTRYIGAPALRVTMARIAKWLLVCWGSFLGLLYVARIVSALAEYFCSLSTGLFRYRLLIREMCMRITLLIWAGVGYGLVPVVFRKQSELKVTDTWVPQLQKGFLFLNIAFAIIFVQGVLLQLINIQYIEGFVGPRTAKACHELEVIKNLNDLVDRHVDPADIGIVAKILKKLFMPINSQDLYYIISRGEGNEEKWTEYASNIWAAISNGQTHLTCSDLCQQLAYMNRDPNRGRELFDQLDESVDGEVTEEEVIALVQKIGLRLNRRTQAMTGIKRLMAKLEVVMSILVLGLLFFVYVQLFNEDLSKKIGNLWTGIVGLSFAFSASIAEFVNSTVFCFGKHPYDIGDYVEVKGKKYIVSQIFLTHTNFEQVQNEHVRGLVCQMSHASLQTEPIVNWTRTIDEASQRHEVSDKNGGDKSGAREDTAAELISAKLQYLRALETEKTKSE